MIRSLLLRGFSPHRTVCLWRAFTLVMALFLAGNAVSQELNLFELKPWRELSDRRISSMARAFLKSGDGDWLHGESDLFIYHGRTLRRMERAAHEAEWAYAEVGARLNLPDPPRRGHIFILEDAATWKEVLRRSGRREDSAALHIHREIFLLCDGERSARYVDIPHEMVHFRLRQAYPDRLPLWLEEGLALFLDWELASAYQANRGLVLFREEAPPPAGAFIGRETLFHMRRYPRDLAEMRAFYRASETWVTALQALLGPEQISVLVERMTRPRADLQDVLEELMNWDHSQTEVWFNRIEEPDGQKEDNSRN